MSWVIGFFLLTENTDKLVVNNCINCVDHKQLQRTITMGYGECNFIKGPIYWKCYSTNWN